MLKFSTDAAAASLNPGGAAQQKIRRATMYKKMRLNLSLELIKDMCKNNGNFEIVTQNDFISVKEYDGPLKVAEMYEGEMVYVNEFIVNNTNGYQVMLYVYATHSQIKNFNIKNKLSFLGQLVGATVGTKYFELEGGDIVTTIDLLSAAGASADIEGQVLAIKRDSNNNNRIEVRIDPKHTVDISGFKGVKLMSEGDRQFYVASLLINPNARMPYLKCNISCRFFKNSEETSIYEVAISKVAAEVEEIRFVEGLIYGSDIKDMVYIKAYDRTDKSAKYSINIEAKDFMYGANMNLQELTLYPEIGEACLGGTFLKADIKKS